MVRVLILLCLFAAPALSEWGPGLKARFDLLGWGSSSFMNLPRTSAQAIQRRWIVVTRPTSPPGLERLVLWCPRNDFAVCVFMDDTGYIAGLQIALDVENFSNIAHDPTTQGFTSWTTSEDGVSKTFWTAQLYFISAATYLPTISSLGTLATDPYTRIANRDDNTILQDGNIWVTGFEGKLYNISTTVSDFIDVEYTTQACIPLMGNHYYYNMSKTTSCGEKSIFPWFPLVQSEQLIGVGFLSTGHMNVPEGKTNWFENPGRAVVKAIVNDGPECLYDLAEDYGVVTMHTYFISNPFLVNCILQ